jgi:hypothetical protein
MLHAADGIWGSPPHFEKSYMILNLRRRPLKIWVLIANITNEFILGLDILCAYDASVDLGRKMLHLSEEEVTPCNPEVGPGLPAW